MRFTNRIYRDDALDANLGRPQAAAQKEAIPMKRYFSPLVCSLASRTASYEARLGVDSKKASARLEALSSIGKGASKLLIAVGTLACAGLGCSGERAPDSDRSSAQLAQPLTARSLLKKAKAPRRPSFEHRLVAKFKDELRVRATKTGELRSDTQGPSALDNAAAIMRLAQPLGMRFSQLIQLPEARIAHLETRATLASKTAQPDFAGIVVVNVPDARLQNAADALHASPLAEFVYFEQLTPPPPQACTDIAPPTPSYVHRQTYHGPNPGVNMTAAWALGPARGDGVRIADCEYAFIEDHEDLCGVIAESGQTPVSEIFAEGWHHHGTAVLGEIVGRDNAFGCTGLAPDAEMYFFPEWTVEGGVRRATAVANAIATMDAGDVVLLEMQAEGTVDEGYVPAEYDPVIWMLTRNATDAGVVVVAAAGNGNQNLDAPSYSDYMARGDSGAIIVGAGSANTFHDKLGLSTYGSRVDVQGWGESIFTTGSGDAAQHGGDINQSYTDGFGGTSGASPFIAAAVASLQSFAASWLERRLTPAEVRSLLIETGVPQGSGGHIGPFPNVAAAIDQIRGGGQVQCGDGICSSSETCQSCASDCGACPSCIPQGCATAPSVTIPYAADGVQDTCVFLSSTPSSINSWNMSRVELNSVDITNLWVPPSSFPASCNGGHYLRSIGTVPWAHVEAR
jgi:hypothetical protein